jgi:hypothetical protein
MKLPFSGIVANCNSSAAITSPVLTESGGIQFNPRRIEGATAVGKAIAIGFAKEELDRSGWLDYP